MAVYVDDMNLQAEVRNGSRVRNSQWSHLTADTDEELHAFARKLGLRREWFQGQDNGGAHYDVTSGKRMRAIQLGATPLTWRQAGEMMAGRHQARRAAADAPVYRCDDIGCTEHPGDDPQSLAAEHPSQRADRAAYEAGCAYRDGRLDRAAHLIATAMGLDPGRRDLWESRARQIVAAADQSGLRQQVAVRLAAAGIDPMDTGLQQIPERNRGVIERHAEAEREAS